MFLTPHSALGVTIAKKIKNPFIALPLALLSHFLADGCIPHWNPPIFREYQKNKKISATHFFIILADFLSSLLLTTYFSTQVYPDIRKAIIIFSGGILSILPDAFEIPFYFLGVKNKWLVKYIKFHHRHQMDVSFWPGILSQLALITLCWLLI